MTCSRFDGRVGYKGQKYAVEYKSVETGEWKVFGWQNEPEGGLLNSVRLWPAASDGRIVPVEAAQTGGGTDKELEGK